MTAYRDVELPAAPRPTATASRKLVVVIGIDRYAHWRPLHNAVSDATGARAVFQRLGFHEPRPPLVDEHASGAALRALVSDELASLSPDDSLIVFFAGHGGTQTHQHGEAQIKTGYLIPVDAEPDKVATWIDLEGWLRSIALLPPRHILVILDACHSGIALVPVIHWRDSGAEPPGGLDALQQRRSRRVITSALDDERAADAGPVAGHSLFTGCLIEALTGGIAKPDGLATGSELAVWVQHRVRTYPAVSQTPDFGAFALDDRGEMVIPLLAAGAPSPAPPRARTRVARPRSAARPELASVLRRWLRRDGDWLAIALPLLATSLAGLLARSC
ncbi:MAG TPA: caspase family protein [Kofleriaceae bacterium]|nr:caspase family protein [Kofleriaceae bacterium]